MSDPNTPDAAWEASVSITPEMRALFKALRSGQSALAGGLPADDDFDPQDGQDIAAKAAPNDQRSESPELRGAGSRQEEPPCPAPATATRPGSRPWCLRRDGKRPLRFQGMPLISTRLQSSVDEICMAFDLFLDSEDRVVAAIALTAGDDMAVRPVFAAESIGSRQELDALLDGFDPARAFPVADAFTDSADEEDLTELIAKIGALRADLGRLTAAARAAQTL